MIAALFATPAAAQTPLFSDNSELALTIEAPSYERQYQPFDMLASARRDWVLLHGGTEVPSPFRPLIVSRDGLPFVAGNGVRITPEAAQRIADNGYIVAVPFIFHWWPKGEALEKKREESRDDWIVADFRPDDAFSDDPEHTGGTAFLSFVNAWIELAGMLNELSRSMGQPDFYPFVVPAAVITKLHFIHLVIQEEGGRADEVLAVNPERLAPCNPDWCGSLAMVLHDLGRGFEPSSV